MKTIVLAITGSISAYKAADITSQLVKSNFEVHVVMSEAATHFITPLTLEVLSNHHVTIDVMTEKIPGKVNHIELAKKADLFLVAPASANTIAKLAFGFADNSITSIALALGGDVKKIIAPAMNTKMYENPITQENISRLKSFGYTEIEPRTALLACGDLGKGALAEVDEIIESVKGILT
ncbi:MAG: phosphopantothenoylcysteine decarboxylase [Streptococcaceae bacterium]|jgi:phosphopantothenoylcysteine decarboxylase|nr:phosphopantothenoylcysteine decarboxylase [Streptococcaceae bacterium]MCH4177854.1 phosphopantothenoylcysteine decarboxylase [Streptococcaceae bacterium]